MVLNAIFFIFPSFQPFFFWGIHWRLLLTYPCPHLDDKSSDGPGNLGWVVFFAVGDHDSIIFVSPVAFNVCFVCKTLSKSPIPLELKFVLHIKKLKMSVEWVNMILRE